jgi:alkanesulfonate monooxygenase SsuD/methylene tetrahydromethanopterin reductase-like flavin-dependent oxidoreductase (luciferase family)
VNGLRIEPMTPRHPRLLVGGGGVGHGDNRQVPRAVKDRILKHAEGWIAPPASPDAIESDWKEIKTYLKCNGRDPTTLDRLALTRTHLVPNVKSGLAREKQRRVFKNRREGDSVLKHGLSGDIEEIREGIERYQELGIDHLILESLTHDPTELEHQLQLFEQYLGDLF